MTKHIYWVDTKKEMLDMATQPDKIGSIVILNDCPYKLIGSFGITSQNNVLKNKSFAMEMFIKCAHIGTISVWKDKNGFRLFSYQY
uniref:Uncharacterized protein n=1 Tax=viral metagenome TaxID=1070528 RepID=A0A6C0KYE7_9ZZZZ|tara:strand:- start:892 stop:1149 length:258 start_codon:yes stop_codon:yes gene_type:complete